MNIRIEKTIKNLKRHNMSGYYLEHKDSLLSLLKELITPGSTVGCGDSVTLEETGVFDYIRQGNYHFLDKFTPGLSKDEKRRIYLQNFAADTFLTGVNAITTDGRLFNIDGNGSRVAPMLYGPNQVIVIAGINKLTDTLEDAITRARQTAAPLDARRLGKSTPCTSLNRCIDCSHKERICNDFVLISGQFTADRIKVILINEELGY